MWRKVNLIYLAACTCASFIEYAHLPSHSRAYTYVWTIASFFYPILLSIFHSKRGFWRDLLTILLVFAISHLVEGLVVLSWGVGFKGILHPDSETLAIFGFLFIEPLGNAIIWYPLGFLVSWLLARRFPSVFRAADSPTTRASHL